MVDDLIDGENIRQCKYCEFYMTCPLCTGADFYCDQWTDRLHFD